MSTPAEHTGLIAELFRADLATEPLLVECEERLRKEIKARVDVWAYGNYVREGFHPVVYMSNDRVVGWDVVRD